MDKKYVVYQHVTPDGFFYFGATSNIKRRWRNNGAEYKRTALQPYIEKFGWDNIQHIVLFKEQTKENALWIENFLIETAQEDGVCINKHRSGLVSKEEDYDKNQSKQYYETNKDRIREQKKEYYEQNKDNIKEQRKQYYEQNKQQIMEQKKEYYEQNKDKFKEYYEQNKDKIREQRRQRYQRKKLEKQLKEFGNLPLW